MRIVDDLALMLTSRSEVKQIRDLSNAIFDDFTVSSANRRVNRSMPDAFSINVDPLASINATRDLR